MKLYIATNNSIKRTINKRIIAYNPFFLVPDEDESFKQLRGMVPVGDMWDTDTITEAVKEIREMRRDFTAKNEQLKGLISQMNTNLAEVQSEMQKVSQMIESANKLVSDADKLKKSLQKEVEGVKALSIDRKEIVDAIDEGIEHIRSRAVSAVVDVANNAINKYNTLIQDMNNATESYNVKVNTLYDNFISKMNDAVDKCKQSEDMARKWSSEQFGQQVADGKYSALHYAQLSNFKEK